MLRYRIVRGDNLSKIAKRYGLGSWREIYFHAANTAFRQLRPNPNLIHPGDCVMVPQATQVSRPIAQQPNMRAKTNLSDESDLNGASADLAIEQARSSRNGREWLAAITRTLKQLPFDAARTMHRNGVLAVYFGRASLLRRGERHSSTELDGIQIKVRTTPKPVRHDGVKLYRGDRIHTLDGGSGILFFLPELYMVEVKTDMQILINGKTTRRARRITRPAHLERGTLRERLSEL